MRWEVFQQLWEGWCLAYGITSLYIQCSPIISILQIVIIATSMINSPVINNNRTVINKDIMRWPYRLIFSMLHQLIYITRLLIFHVLRWYCCLENIYYVTFSCSSYVSFWICKAEFISCPLNDWEGQLLLFCFFHITKILWSRIEQSLQFAEALITLYSIRFSDSINCEVQPMHWYEGFLDMSMLSGNNIYMHEEHITYTVMMQKRTKPGILIIYLEIREFVSRKGAAVAVSWEAAEFE